ncbi:hypothetical protein GIB67_007586 [Kingdonia uniflora]|uniref:ubiquitinyl hydrolase 1 n=1 Tax=Kingdonia uniflora TaxID=39325 RepID=A0A7J7N1A3_9MAGN|nr:hypothetical protein GIB67_007586 [Kingdonia uniflora]
MEGPSNGGLLYHESQVAKLCALHTVNTVLQGPVFTVVDFEELASDLDREERRMLLEGGGGLTDDFLRFNSEESHNVSMDGDFSIQVLQKALEVWDLEVIPLGNPTAETGHINTDEEIAFICHWQDHWFSIRKVNGEWYNFNSLNAAPMYLSKFHVSAYIDSLKGAGWSIFTVRGKFIEEYPTSSADASQCFGQWLSPEDAQRIIKSCNSIQSTPNKPVDTIVSQPPSPYDEQFDEDLNELLEFEDEDLKAAIANSLMDSGPPNTTADSASPNTKSDPAGPTTSETGTSNDNKDQ